MIRLDCGCSPTHGQSCTWCDGTAAEAGITPPAPELLSAAAWAAAQPYRDPWLTPAAFTDPPF